MAIRPLGRRLAWITIVLMVALGACGDEGRLADELSRDHGLAIVGLPTSDHRTLLVAFPSSPFAERGDAERRRFARKIAEYVRDHYPPYKGLDKVIVEFPTKKEMAADTLKHVAISYTFTRAELDSSAP